MKRKAKRRPRGREKPIPAGAKRLAQHIQRLRRLDAKRDQLNKETVQLLDWAEKELVGPALVKHYKLGTQEQVDRALKKERPHTDSQKHIGAALMALLRKTGNYPTHKELMKQLGEMLPANRVPPKRTLRYITKERHYPIAPAKTGRRFAKKRVNQLH